MVWQCQFVDWSIWLSSDFYSTWKDFVGQHRFTSDQPSASQGWLKTRQLLAYLEIISNICWKTQFFHIDQYSVPLFEAVIIWISQRHQSFKKLEQWPYENVKQVSTIASQCHHMTDGQKKDWQKSYINIICHYTDTQEQTVQLKQRNSRY